MTMRRAAVDLSQMSIPAQSTIMAATAALLRRASASETAFIRLAKAGIQDELVDMAWAVIGEPRPGGPAVPVQEEKEGESA